MTCPTLACDWLASWLLRMLGLLVSHPDSVTLFTITLSVLVWLADCLSDMVVIDALWQFNLPLMWVTFPFSPAPSIMLLTIPFTPAPSYSLQSPSLLLPPTPYNFLLSCSLPPPSLLLISSPLSPAP